MIRFLKKHLLFINSPGIISSIGDIAQLGEHPLDVRKVTGSNPVISTLKKPRKYAVLLGKWRIYEVFLCGFPARRNGIPVQKKVHSSHV